MRWKRILKWSPLVVLVFLFAWFQIAYWTSTNDCQRSVRPGGERMKAIKFCEYGPPDILKVEEVEKPVPKDNELLVRVRAASLNFIDAGLVRGPSVLRFISGLRKPKFTGFGRDFAGVVEVVGKDVIEFKPGDEVFGLKWGALAEYVSTEGKTDRFYHLSYCTAAQKIHEEDRVYFESKWHARSSGKLPCKRCKP